MNIMGKLPEAPSKRWTLNGVDVAKIARDWIVTLLTMALTWLAANQGFPVVINGKDYTATSMLLIPLVIKPTLESLRRLAANGVKDDTPGQ
jgi:hypothetical protein